MIIRIVRMTLRPDAVDPFLALYDEASPRIRAFPGCRELLLYQDLAWPGLVTTHSLWDSPEALERYRGSDLFRSTWERTRLLFAAPASAASHTLLRPDPAG